MLQEDHFSVRNDDLPVLCDTSAEDEKHQRPLDMSTFVTAASHDMKNSISVIAALLEDALREMDDPDASTTSAASIRSVTHQALYETQRVNCHLIQIMAIYKIDQGLYPFEPEEIELAAFMDEAKERVRPLASIKGLSVEVKVDADAGEGFFDRELIFSVIVQSLFNAIKYTRTHIVLSAKLCHGQIEIRVEDDGAGFPAFMLEKGFAERSSIDTRTGSTGLGLYFARQVAQLHRNRGYAGSTRLENGGTLGGGCFVITLP
jgi:signal transduction histidine kinase